MLSWVNALIQFAYTTSHLIYLVGWPTKAPKMEVLPPTRCFLNLETTAFPESSISLELCRPHTP